jgi:hypothetical protein
MSNSRQKAAILFEEAAVAGVALHRHSWQMTIAGFV